MASLRRFVTPANFCRLALVIVLVFAVQHLRDARPPWKSMWAKHLAQGRNPTFGDALEVGFWWGAVARAAAAAALLGLSACWFRSRDVPGWAGLRLGAAGATEVPSRVFWSTMLVITLGAAVMRLPRMTHSFWGDEADAVATYIHGQFRSERKQDPQGPLYFEQPLWLQTVFSARHGPNNHVLFSLAGRACLRGWQGLAGRGPSDFAEWPVRVPSLAAGLASLLTLACLLRRWGAPGLGLLAAAVMALHPWHLRYSTEARGYALMLCLLPLVLHLLTNALERGRWRDWILFSLGEFLLVLSWPGVAYALAFLNLAAFALILCGPGRRERIVGWITANVLSGAVFISIYAPQVPQIVHYNKTHLWLRGLPMDADWLHNILAAPLTGIPFHGWHPANPAEVSWERLLTSAPILTATGFGLLALSLSAGLILLWRRRWQTALMVASSFLAAVVAALHFKFVVKDEMRVWYLIFTLPSLAICVAAGLAGMGGAVSRWTGASTTSARRLVPTLALLVLGVAAVWPMNASLMARASEDFKGAVGVSRGRHEDFRPEGRSRILTCWLWRSSFLYDPRGEIHVRNAAQLRERIAEARASGGRLFVVVGFRDLAEQLNADMLGLLEDSAWFEKIAVFPAAESLHTLEVYRLLN